jgi:hypothetical protein
MIPVGFELTISAGVRPQPYALDRAANGTLFLYITCTKSTANLKRIANLIVSPDTSTVYGQVCWTVWTAGSGGAGVKQRLVVCVLSVTE